MDFISDNFISYSEDFTIKQEKPSPHDLPISSSQSITSESTTVCTTLIPTTLQNFLNTTEESTRFEKQIPSKKHKPFIVIKPKKEEPTEVLNIKIEDEEKLVSKSKRILKREKAKQRSQLKLEPMSLPSPTSSMCLPEGFGDCNMDDKTKKKMAQMIRNRISAQNSRDRKRAYVCHLEVAKTKLADDNDKLAQDKTELLNEIKRLEDFQIKLLEENKCIKKSLNIPLCGSCNFGCKETQLSGINLIPLAKGLEKELSELSDQLLAKLPDCNKEMFSNTFALATFVSVNIIMNLSQQKGLAFESASNIEEIKKLVCQTFEQLFLNGSQNKEIPNLSTALSNFDLLNKDFLSGFGSNFMSQGQNKPLIQTSIQNQLFDFIKVEEDGVIHSSELFKTSFEEDFKDMFAEHDTSGHLEEYKSSNVEESSGFLQFFNQKPYGAKEPSLQIQ